MRPGLRDQQDLLLRIRHEIGAPTVADVCAGLDIRTGVPRPVPMTPDSRDAAILLPLHDGPRGAEVVLIERGLHTGTHRGDIAFPGGVAHPGEPLVSAALRETEEEIGLPPASVRVVTALDAHPTMTAFVIWPFVGALETPVELRPDGHEVVRAFSVPLADLAADGAYWQDTFNGGDHLLPYFAVPGGVAWGTTGNLLVELLVASWRGSSRRKD
jgi:8-oxo-dGTP pyrophosphatase MutT (NUDIX family)